MFRHFASIIGAYPRLEGTHGARQRRPRPQVHANYMLNPAEYPEIGTRLDAVDDKFFFAQGPTRGAGRDAIRGLKPAFERFSRIDNVATF